MNSTPRVDHARQCAGKVPHVDRRAARRARQKLGHRDAEGHLTIYRYHGAAIRELELEQAERRSTSARSTRLGTTSVAVSTSSTGCSA